MRLINELMIRWHRWRMEKTFDTSRELCRYHAERLVLLIKARGARHG